MIGRVLSDEFFENRDWPVASAVAILILLLLVIPIMLFQRLAAARARGCQVRSRGLFARTMPWFWDLIFLYAADPLDDGVLVQQFAPGDGMGCSALAQRSSGTCALAAQRVRFWPQRGSRSASRWSRPVPR
jgi:hypothetical protein